MREHIFRGKRVDNGEFVYGNLYRDLDRDNNESVSIIEIKNPKDWIGTTSFHEVIPETVGEYTGLKDKNGREIYEGDVVRGNWLGGDRDGLIVFIEDIASFGIIFKGRNTPCALINKRDWFSDGGFQCEIIDNIHDTPELLEVAE